ncbi:acyl-CoA dehydrogenase family protein [Bradyrhizobium sp.]|uniref:acyl-CoA dehydrogenase family protein n=1 Tax=Bradyrhizobium sp. TaxID=376 RepID=UPI0039E606CF
MQNDDLVASSARRLFADVADIQTVVAAKDTGWKDRLWAGIEETGLNVAALPEELGGAGLGLHDSLGVLRVAGQAALATPLAETLLAGWMLGAAGLEMPAGKIAFGPSSFSDDVTLHADGTVSGRVARLAFARECTHAALLAQGPDGLSVVLIALDGASIEPKSNLAYEPVDRVTFSKCRPVAPRRAPATFTADTALLMGAAARSLQIAGALEKMLALTTDYVMQRRAFERLISGFQSVQHSVAQLAGEVAVSVSAARSAADALEGLLKEGRGFDDPELRLEVISAKIRTAAAAQKGAAIAHQLHGAIGVTREHVLHRLTLRALAWRDDYGNESQWRERLGQLVCERGPEALWPLLATR